jgi:hypothetical protein
VAPVAGLVAFVVRLFGIGRRAAHPRLVGVLARLLRLALCGLFLTDGDEFCLTLLLF